MRRLIFLVTLDILLILVTLDGSLYGDIYGVTPGFIHVVHVIFVINNLVRAFWR